LREFHDDIYLEIAGYIAYRFGPSSFEVTSTQQ